MFLKSLTLKGFKSFADTTHLEFEPGITVVVGPNGSGKSNVVDAVAWVLGAQAAKTIRSNKMEDVIFAGSSKRAPLGRAEVSLTIDNTSGMLPIAFTEVTLTRTLFRNGDSEYAINGAPVRLLDIQELLSDSGVGRQQHVIVSQGQLDAVLNARPEDRRAIIEEAAGVLKYRRRRERSHRRLEATEVNFTRLGDLMREITRQLKPLERQAVAARQHEAMTTELRALRMHVSGRELAGLRTRAAGMIRQRTELKTVEGSTRTRLSQLDTDVILAEAALGEASGLAAGAWGSSPADNSPTAVAGDAPDRDSPSTVARDGWTGVDLGEAVARAEAAHQKARGLVALLAERSRSLERERNAFLDEGVVATLEAEAARLTADLAAAQATAERLPPEFDTLLESEGELTEERTRFLDDWGTDTAPSSEAGPSAAAVRIEVEAARSAAVRTRQEIDRIETRLGALATRAERAARELETATVELASIGDDPLVDPADRARAEGGLADAEAAVASAQDHLKEAAAEHRAWGARVDALTAALDEARARAGAQRLAGLDGIIGTLLDLVDVDSGWEAAFEAAIGEALSAVIVRDVASGRAALAHLRSRDLTGAVLALGATVAAPSPALLHEIGVPIRHKVRSSRPEVERALDALLGTAVAVEGEWSAALDLSLAHPALTVVTRAGDRFGASGWRAGAGSAGATGAALEEATGRVAAGAGEVEAAERVLSAARGSMAGAKAIVEASRRSEQQIVAERTRRGARRQALEGVGAKLQRDLADITAERVALEPQQAELAARHGFDLRTVSAREADLPALVEAESEAAARAAQRREASRRLDERASAVAALRKDLEVRAAGLEERQRMLTSRSAEIDTRLLRHREERIVAEARRIELDQVLAHTQALQGLVAERAAMLEGGLAELRERRRRQSEAARQATAQLDGLRRERQSAERLLAETRERLQRVEIDETEVRLRLENLTEQIRREFDCEPSTIIDAPLPDLPAGTAPTTRVRDLERDLRLLGPINPLALEEFTALQERHALIESQLADVKTTRRDLQKIMKAIDDEIVTVFAAAFADVRDNFEKLFTLLFPGGQGGLRLTDPDNLLDTGIDVDARPSGKNVKKLSLLSGGERSLTALAYLFAVFRSRPSPFYLLDEVEAALDDPNLHRFLTLLDEFRQEAQLLVISHQKRTMEAADCLYGVTMQPGGSSKVVSERIGLRA